MVKSPGCACHVAPHRACTVHRRGTNSPHSALRQQLEASNLATKLVRFLLLQFNAPTGAPLAKLVSLDDGRGCAHSPAAIRDREH
jgi:hypothetical protein